MMALITTQQLDYQYQKNQPVLKQINLTIKHGVITGLLGINGAGKSTLISLLTGQLKTQSGSIKIFGKNYNQHRFEILRQIALVPQGYAFYPSLNVEENLLFFANLRTDLKNKQSRLSDALTFCQLEKFSKTPANKLSGGLKRRLNLAIGIINKPKLLFLDEPTVGIDPLSRDFILKAIQKLKDTGVSIIYTSHHMTEIEILCEQIIILNKGVIRYQGNLEKLKNQQNYYFSATLDNPKKILDFCKKYNLNINSNKIFGTLKNNIDVQKFTLEFNNQNAQPKSFSLQPSRIEDLFINLIKTDV
jgi:ABC-2 type transport system ATP-binding protein